MPQSNPAATMISDESCGGWSNAPAMDMMEIAKAAIPVSPGIRPTLFAEDTDSLAGRNLATVLDSTKHHRP